MMMTELGMYAQYLRLFTLQQFPFIRIWALVSCTVIHNGVSIEWSEKQTEMCH
jgi:hypothetical protein